MSPIPRVALCIAVALAVVLPARAHAAAAPLVSKASGLCLDVTGNSTANGQRVQIYTCNRGPNQQWESNAAGEIRTFGGTRCLDVAGQSRALESPVISYPCNGQDNQKWIVNANGTIVGKQSGLCLDVHNGGTDPKTPVQIWTCTGNANQVWAGLPSTNGDTLPPSVPGNLHLADLTCNAATLSWSASTDNVGVSNYDIYHDGQLLATVGGTKLSSALKLTPNANWGLYVNARDVAGNVSQASATLPIKVPACTVDTQAPTVPTGLAGSISGTTAALTWSASTDNVGVTAYDVYRNGAKVGSTASLRFTDSGLAVNTAYTYSLTARDAQNNVSSRSASVQLTTGGACSNAVCSVTQVTTDTDIPWGLVTLPDGTVLYTRRDVHDIVLLNPASGAKTTVGTLPDVSGTDGEGGLLGLAITSGFPASDPWLYIFYTTADDNRIVRIKYANAKLDLSTQQVLIKGILRNKFHNGGRLRFGPDGKLYASTGDAQNGANAQSLQTLNGKVLRLNADGSVPSDNPFGTYVWSYGHRNPQGLAFDAQGRLWEQEFGDATMDETNLIQKGGNYGWPDCEGTVSHSGQGCASPGYIAPKYTYPTSEGSCSGIAIVRGALYVACERGTRVYREVISGDSLTNVQQLFAGTYGRIRTVEPTLDGNLWMTTTNEGDKDSIANNSNEKILKVILGN